MKSAENLWMEDGRISVDERKINRCGWKSGCRSCLKSLMWFNVYVRACSIIKFTLFCAVTFNNQETHICKLFACSTVVLGDLMYAKLVRKFPLPPLFLRKTKVQYRVIKSPSVVRILTHINPHPLWILTYILILSYKLYLRLPINFLLPVLCFKIELLATVNFASPLIMLLRSMWTLFSILERDLTA